MPASIIVVSGVPGAGKSTVAPLLARRFARGVHVEADVLQQMIVSGGRWPDQEPLDEGQRQLRLRGANACLLARSFHAAGFTVVIDDIVIGERFEHFAADLDGLAWDLVQLLPDLATVKARNAGRTAKNVFDQWAHLDAVARATGRGFELDSSGMDPAATVEAILPVLGTAARVAATHR